MSLQEYFSDPGSVRAALLGLAGAAALGALIARRIRQKLHPEPRVIRLTLDQQAASPRVMVDPSAPNAYPAIEASWTGETDQSPALPGPAAIPDPAAVFRSIAIDESSPVMEHPAPSRESDTDIPNLTAETTPQDSPGEAIPKPVPEETLPLPDAEPAYPLLALQERSPVMLDILRGVVIIGAILVFAAFILVVLPQGAVDKIASALRPRNAPGPPPEKIAFLYLGDEIKDNQFHIRGVVRNITGQPLEQLQATVRLYAADRTLLETQVVRMDSEIIFPNNTASFHLSFSDYHGQFGSYSLDFKLAQGDPVPYRDVREARAGS